MPDMLLFTHTLSGSQQATSVTTTRSPSDSLAGGRGFPMIRGVALHTLPVGHNESSGSQNQCATTRLDVLVTTHYSQRPQNPGSSESAAGREHICVSREEERLGLPLNSELPNPLPPKCNFLRHGFLGWRAPRLRARKAFPAKQR